MSTCQHVTVALPATQRFTSPKSQHVKGLSAQLQGWSGASTSPAAALGRAPKGGRGLRMDAAGCPGGVHRQAPATAAATTTGVTAIGSRPSPAAALRQPICTLEVLQPLLRVSHALLLLAAPRCRQLPLPHAGKGGSGCRVVELPAVSGGGRPLLSGCSAGHTPCPGISTGTVSLPSKAGQRGGCWPQLPRQCFPP